MAIGRFNRVAVLTGFSSKKMYGHFVWTKTVAIIKLGAHIKGARSRCFR